MIMAFLFAFVLAYLIGRVFIKTTLHISVIATGFGIAFCSGLLHTGKIYMIVLFTIVVSFIMWAIVYFFKGLLIGLKGKKRYFLWIPLLIALTAFICIPPGFVFAKLFVHLTGDIEIPYRNVWAWAIGLFFSYRAYREFNLLNDSAPHKAFRFYKAGVDLVV